MFTVLFPAIFIVIAALLVFAVRTRNIFGCVLGLNTLGTVIVVLMSALGALMNQADYFDIALLYILLNFSLTMALLRFFRSRRIPGDVLKNVSQVPLTPVAHEAVGKGAPPDEGRGSD